MNRELTVAEVLNLCGPVLERLQVPAERVHEDLELVDAIAMNQGEVFGLVLGTEVIDVVETDELVGRFGFGS